MQCPRCQTESSGTFCAECGAPLSGAKCAGCQAELLAGAHFCTACGRPVRERTSNAPWYVAAVAIVALVAVVTLQGSGSSGTAPTPGPGTPAASDPGAGGQATAPPLTGTPREQADRLFNRVLSAEASGDSAEAAFFLPIAVQAYRMAGNLDADGLYHLSILLAAGGNFSEARATAEQILAEEPNHLLALGSAAQASSAAGDGEAAREYYARLVNAYESARGDSLPEYVHHERMLPEYLETARQFLDR